MDTDPIEQRIADRREQLAKYRAVYAETYDEQIEAEGHELRDRILTDLLAGQPVPSLGRPVTIVGHPTLSEVTGWLLSTADGFADVKTDARHGGAIYRVPSTNVRLAG